MMGRSAPCLSVLLLGLFLAVYTMVHAEIDVQTGLECVDKKDQCPFWARKGECQTNRNFMNEHCRKSCDRCKVMRVSSAEEMQQLITSKKKEILEKKQRREALRVLQGKEL
jgi:ShK domain-like